MAIETITELISRYPGLGGCYMDIEKAEKILIDTFSHGGVLYTCGNGGSAADADHIVGELLKGFLLRREISDEMKEKIRAACPEVGESLAENLQGGLRAVSLHSQSAFLTAFANDVDPAMMFGQALYSLGREGDCLIAISTSGNSKNVVYAAAVAKALGISVITLTGEKKCKLDALSDCIIHAAATETYKVQELHLPVYHRLCAAVEDEFFGKEKAED